MVIKMSKIKGLAYVLGDNIDTDQIIPAIHLVYKVEGEESKMYGKLALSGLPEDIIKEQPFIENDSFTSKYTVLIAGKNFGCGSSREHAPLALQKAGLQAVVAVDYARIFYRNAVDGGFIIPYEIPKYLGDYIKTGDEVEIDLENDMLKNLSTKETYSLSNLGSAKEIIEAGGIFEYARKKKLIK